MGRDTRTGGRRATQGVIAGRCALSVGRSALPQPEGFTWRALTDLARLESGHTPSRAKPEYWSGDVPWIGIRDATGNHGRVIDWTAECVTQSGLDHSSARLLPAGTVCLSRTASVGFVVEMGRPMATSQDFVNWVCGPDLNSHYLRYLLVSEQESVRRFAQGTTHQTMYYPEAKALQVLVPPRRMQDAATSVLSALDDKIAANRRVVAALSDLAAAHCAASLDGSQAPLARIAAVTMGASPPGESYNETGDGLPFYQGVRDFGVRFPQRRIWTSRPTRLASAGDTLLSVRAPVGSTNRAVEDLCLGRGVAGLRSRSDKPMTLFHQLRALGDEWAPFEAVGTVFGAINKAQLSDIPVPTVNPERAEDVERRLAALESRIDAALREDALLARTRDELIPLLMSGKVRIQDTEKIAEEVLDAPA